MTNPEDFEKIGKTARVTAAYLRTVREDIIWMQEKAESSTDLTASDIARLHDIIDGLGEDINQLRAVLNGKRKLK